MSGLFAQLNTSRDTPNLTTGNQTASRAKVEIPLSSYLPTELSQLTPYDTNKSGGFDVYELDKMPDEAASTALMPLQAHRLELPKLNITPRQMAELITDLPVDRAGRLLSLSAIGNEIFSEIFKWDREKAADILIASGKERNDPDIPLLKSLQSDDVLNLFRVMKEKNPDIAALYLDPFRYPDGKVIGAMLQYEEEKRKDPGRASDEDSRHGIQLAELKSIHKSLENWSDIQDLKRSRLIDGIEKELQLQSDSWIIVEGDKKDGNGLQQGRFLRGSLLLQNAAGSGQRLSLPFDYDSKVPFELDLLSGTVKLDGQRVARENIEKYINAKLSEQPKQQPEPSPQANSSPGFWGSISSIPSRLRQGLGFGPPETTTLQELIKKEKKLAYFGISDDGTLVILNEPANGSFKAWVGNKDKLFSGTISKWVPHGALDSRSLHLMEGTLPNGSTLMISIKHNPYQEYFPSLNGIPVQQLAPPHVAP